MLRDVGAVGSAPRSGALEPVAVFTVESASAVAGLVMNAVTRPPTVSSFDWA
jgi:hypothetical protein